MLWAAAIWLVLFVAVVVGNKQWTMNAQPWHLWRQGYSLFEAWLVWDKDALRYVVYWPMFVVAEGLDVHADAVFTLASTLASLGLIYALIQCEFLLTGHASLWRASFYASLIVALSFFMDGRITILLTGYSLIVLAALQLVARDQWTLGQTAALIGGGLLCSLSSGTLTVAGAFVGALATWAALRMTVHDARRSAFCALLSFFILYGGWIFAGVIINLAFYQYDALAMLDHGIGSNVLLIGPVWGGLLLCIIALAGVWSLIWLDKKQSKVMFVLTLAVASAAAGGVFGITAMSIGLVPLLLAARLQLWRELS